MKIFDKNYEIVKNEEYWKETENKEDMQWRKQIL